MASTFQFTPTDVSVIINVASNDGGEAEKQGQSFATELRVTPTWAVSQLKRKLETMTGIPPDSQRLRLKAPGQREDWMDGDDRIVEEWRLVRGCEIEVRKPFLFLATT